MKIIEVIGRDAQHTVFLKCSGDCVQKIARENPSELMAPLRPWVGKQKIKSFNRTCGQQVAHGEQRVRAQHPHVFNLLDFPANFLDALC